VFRVEDNSPAEVLLLVVIQFGEEGDEEEEVPLDGIAQVRDKTGQHPGLFFTISTNINTMEVCGCSQAKEAHQHQNKQR
jgi:hypothetical protein